MTIDEIMQFRRANPFRPFALALNDGRRFLIREPKEIGRNSPLTWLAVSADEDSAEVLYGAALVNAHIEVLESGDLLQRSVG